MPEHPSDAVATASPFASASVVGHLVRGAIGFGLIGVALVLLPAAGPASLLLAPLGMLALRGCPTCWIAGLIATISAGRLQRACTESGCTLHGRISGSSPTECSATGMRKQAAPRSQDHPTPPWCEQAPRIPPESE
jgi:hypothetical protein